MSTLDADVVVLGSGIAGLSFALDAARDRDVLLFTKRQRSEANTAYAQGGLSSVLDPTDSFDDHVRDTLVAGAGLCKPDVVELCVQDGPDAVRRLVEWGVRFDRGEDGTYDLGREGGHSHRRVLHAGDITGREIERALVAAVSAHPRIRVFDDHHAVDLITSGKHLRRGGTNRCHVGLFVADRLLCVQSAIDNLGKGAAGQAVQCLNLMAGRPETEGLTQAALFP